MAAVLDIAQIEKDLRAINQQRSETRERLDALKGGRGRGRGDGRPGGIFSRLGHGGANGAPSTAAAGPAAGGGGGRPSVFDRLYSQGSRGAAAADQHDRRDAGPPARGDANGSSRRITSRISSAVVAPADRADRERSKERGEQQHADADAALERADSAGAGAGRKRLLSAVVVNGQARQLSSPPEKRAASPPVERPAKRPALAADDKTKRRAARMFGTLLVGTLQKFQHDEQEFKKTDTAQRRAEMERRAQERAEAEAARLREEAQKQRDEAASAWREERASKLNALHDLNLQADVKALELRYAKRIQVKQQTVGFCVTTTQPPLCWLPKQVSQETEPLLQQSQDAFEAWKQQQLQELESERAELMQAAATKREVALTRLAAREPPGGEGGGGASAGNEEGDEAEEEQEQSGDGGSEDGDDRRQAGSEQGQDSGRDEREQQDDDMQEVEGAGQEEAEEQPRVRRPRHRDDDEERLLSSDDEDV